MAIEKTKIVPVRFNPKDEDWIIGKARQTGLKKSTYIREVTLGRIPQDEADFSKYDHTEALQNLRKELLRIGNNVNQMARVANATGGIHGERLEQIRAELGEVNARIMRALL